VIVYKRFNQFNDHGAYVYLLNDGRLWLEANVGSTIDNIAKIRPNSSYVNTIWSPVYEWQDLSTEFKKITGDLTLKDRISITYGAGWTMATSFAYEQSFKTGSMPGDSELWIVIDDDALAVQFKLVVM
jgi:hypothetical protein